MRRKPNKSSKDIRIRTERILPIQEKMELEKYIKELNIKGTKANKIKNSNIYIIKKTTLNFLKFKNI